MAVRLGDLHPTPQRYLLDPYLPVGTLSLLTGAEGSGKTWLACWLTALVTRGDPAPWASGSAPPRDVLWVAAESSPSALIRRLDAQEADLNRIVLADPHEDDVFREIKDNRPLLIVLDPLEDVCALHGGRPSQLRRRLLDVVRAARRVGAAVLGIRHLTKSRRGSIGQRGVGSYAVRAVARSEIHWGADPQQPDRRVLCHVKANESERGPTHEFEISGGRLEWVGRSGLSSEDLLGPPPRPERGPGAIEIAMGRLEEILGPVPILASEVYALCPGIADRTLREAAQRLGVTIRQERQRGRITGWWWSLASEMPVDPAEPQADLVRATPRPQITDADAGNRDDSDRDEDNPKDPDEYPGVARFRLLDLD